MTDQSKTTAYLKRTCPYCLKLRIFLTETGLDDQFDYQIFDDGDETHKTLRARMETQGLQPSFPAVENADGTLTTGTDDLINRFAKDAGEDPSRLPLLDYYSRGVFKRQGEMFHELKALKEAQPI